MKTQLFLLLLIAFAFAAPVASSSSVVIVRSDNSVQVEFTDPAQETFTPETGDVLIEFPLVAGALVVTGTVAAGTVGYAAHSYYTGKKASAPLMKTGANDVNYNPSNEVLTSSGHDSDMSYSGTTSNSRMERMKAEFFTESRGGWKDEN